ncbi:MAG: hypothetical protein JSV26_08060 [bacterium]|nr:MAG: hypothetical protein JSV26_08060 [bacterium]
MKILCIGNINFDILFPIHRMPEQHEKVTCPESMVGFGGSAANTAYWLARLGCDVSLAGTVGDDALGREHIASLAEAGVDTSSVQVVGMPSGIAVVLAREREKRMIRAPGANLAGTFRPEVLDGCGLVFLSGANATVLGPCADAARRAGLTVFSGSGCLGEERVLSASDGFILNSDELEYITGLYDPREGIMALDALSAAVTLPTGGCLISDGIHLHSVEADQVDPVDRTGAGDAFAAGYLAGFARGEPAFNRGVWGNLMAAEVLMGWGARPEIAIPGALQPGDQE